MPRTKRKIMVRRIKKFMYPAAGFQSDIEGLLQKFVDTKSIRFENFVRLWREGNFSLIHAGRNGLREKREFVEEAFKIVSKFALPPYSLQVRVGALYTLYSVYHTQRTVPKIKVRIPLACWRDIVDLHQEVITHKHLDVDYIIRKMKHDGVFEFVAYASQMTVEDLYECEDDDETLVVNESVDTGWPKAISTASSLLDEDSLGQLTAVHDKYHQLKCQLNALRGGESNTPSSSLDLIKGDLVDSLVELAQARSDLAPSDTQAEQSSPAPSASHKKQAKERASRVKEIKQRAQSARANTSSSALSQNGQAVSTAPLATEYLHRWISAAQQRQQTVHAHPPKKRRKINERGESAQVAPNSLRRFGSSASNLPLTSASLPTPLPAETTSTVSAVPAQLHREAGLQLPAPSALHHGSGPAARGGGKRYKRYAKPPYSYVSLITLAILSSPEKKLRLAQILKRIAEMFPFFNGSYQGWRDSVRHNLSQNECFVKVLKNPYRPTAKGNYWTVNVSAIAPDLLQRQNTLVSRYAQDSGFRYRKDLTEVFDLSNGNLKIGIPRRLFKSGLLIEDPAAIMEALLLEDAASEDGTNVCPVKGRLFSLEDLFNQDDFVDDDVLRHQQCSNRWSGRAPRGRVGSTSAASSQQVPGGAAPEPCSPMTAAFRPYMNSVESQKLALLMQNANAVASMANGPGIGQSAARSTALAASGSNLSSYLPLLQNFYAMAQCQAQGGLNGGIQLDQKSAPPSSLVSSPSPTGPPPLVQVRAGPICKHEAQPNDALAGVAAYRLPAAKSELVADPGPGLATDSVKVEPPPVPPRSSSAGDSGIAGSISPQSPVRFFCSGDHDATATSGCHASPVSSHSDVAVKPLASSPRQDCDDAMVAS